VKSVSEVQGKKVHQGLIGTCTNGRIEDIRIAAEILDGKKIAKDFQLLVIPASKRIYLQMVEEGLISKLMNAGANVLAASCGPCLGTGQGIPADNYTVISTANRNFKGRMGNKNSEIYLASPACVAWSAINGVITDPRGIEANDKFPFTIPPASTVEIKPDDNRRVENVWDYADVDNLNTDQMFAGNLTYSVLSSEGKDIVPHLFKGFDVNFAEKAQENDIMIAGDNFGCGSSREHPSVGLAYIGIKAVIVKSVNRIFYRSSVNQGLPIIVAPEIVNSYKRGDKVGVHLDKGLVMINGKEHKFAPLPDDLLAVFKAKGLVNYLNEN